MAKQKYYVVWEGRKPGYTRPGRIASSKRTSSRVRNTNPMSPKQPRRKRSGRAGKATGAKREPEKAAQALGLREAIPQEIGNADTCGTH